MTPPKLKIASKKYSGETVIVSMRIPKDMLENIDGVALRTGRSRNELLSTFIEFSLENLQIETNTDKNK
ncbi:MAG: CopG family transcriptional regulator [Clostridiales bacterium]|nr:CopG family transcriptional regulator [Clostridiales bacterium]